MYLPTGKELRKEFSREKWRQGGEYWRAGLVKDTVQGKGVWQATVIGATGSCRVRIRVKGRSLRIDCSCFDEYCPKNFSG